MYSDIESTQVTEVDGAIQSINAPCREMKVSVDGTARQFDIAAECSVWLHGERVKLRILQAADPVRISYVIQDGACLAVEIRVRN